MKSTVIVMWLVIVSTVVLMLFLKVAGIQGVINAQMELNQSQYELNQSQMGLNKANSELHKIMLEVK